MTTCRRRDFIQLLGLGAATSMFMPGRLLAGESSKPSRPNVLFIAVDDLKPMLGCYGDTQIKSPNIDRLAARGMTFLNNHCQQAVCGPSRASLLTGMRPDQTKVWDLKTLIRKINPDVVTLPQHFKENGYESVGMGKIFDPRSVQGQENDDPASWSRPYYFPPDDPQCVRGFRDPQTVARLREELQALHEQGIKGAANVKKAGLKLPPTECIDVPDDAYEEGKIALHAVDTLKALAAVDKPFFLGIGFKKPHLPFIAPKKYWDLYKREEMQLATWQKMPLNAPEIGFQNSWELRSGYNVSSEQPLPEELQARLIHGYHACVSYTDAQIGKVLDALDASGKADNTIIVLWGDHGWHLGDHGMWCKHTNFEQATRSPMIMVAPWLINKGTTTTMPTEFVDIYPTLCDLAHLPKTEQLAGDSLLPIFKDPANPFKLAAMSQFSRMSDGKPAMGYALRTDRYRYIEWVEKDYRRGVKAGKVVARELYDYQVDPLETRSFVDDPAYTKVLADMQQLARKHWEIAD